MSCAFETSCTSELITIIVFIENIREVELAMHNMCSQEESLKAGLKLELGTLIKQCCAILIDHYATSGQRTPVHQREVPADSNCSNSELVKTRNYTYLPAICSYFHSRRQFKYFTFQFFASVMTARDLSHAHISGYVIFE